MKTVLTDRFLKSLKPAEAGKRLVIWDAATPGFGCRVTERGAVSFFVMRRPAGRPDPVRLVLGQYPALTLAKARTAASKALEDLVAGVHPKEREREEAERKAAVEREKALGDGNRFAKLAADFVAKHASKKRTGKAIGQLIDRVLVSRWGAMPVSEIRKSDVIRMVEEVGEKSGPYAAHQALVYARRVFNWALARDYPGLDRNPAQFVDAGELAGEREARQRVLTEAELKLIWQATEGGDEAYPLGPFVRLLLLTGARRSEVAGMRWSEVNLENAVWIIPRARTKTNVANEVPLSKTALELLKTLPRFTGDFVFSTNGGTRPISGFTKLKQRLDRSIAKPIDDWRLHDLRRTVRTKLAALGVSPFIAELCIGHAQKGVHAVYDLHRYQSEKRQAFEKWAAALRDIVKPHSQQVLRFARPVYGPVASGRS